MSYFLVRDWYWSSIKNHKVDISTLLSWDIHISENGEIFFLSKNIFWNLVKLWDRINEQKNNNRVWLSHGYNFQNACSYLTACPWYPFITILYFVLLLTCVIYEIARPNYTRFIGRIELRPPYNPFMTVRCFNRKVMQRTFRQAIGHWQVLNQAYSWCN